MPGHRVSRVVGLHVLAPATKALYSYYWQSLIESLLHTLPQLSSVFIIAIVGKLGA